MTSNIDALYQRYAPMVFRRCRRILRSDERAAEAMQEVFVKVIRYYPETPVGSSSSLLYRVATTVSLNLARGEREVAAPAAVPFLEWQASGENLEEASIARRFLETLFKGESDRETSQTIAYCHFVDRMTLEEVAEVVGMSVSGVRKRIARMRRSAQALVSREEE